ncbi:RUN domain-containing protein 1-like isoform X1 [Homarus americanus]|nr:RUN domain-containing protein 1-like isoform X1 [Homarus americanus]XP_042242784.1 RUN domain-containing protein 1-like isoform X1 [Homarus americanus]XP_042242785.1 RUN domain-containing protein 1-like isoform X1 [Homarus americanus]
MATDEQTLDMVQITSKAVDGIGDGNFCDFDRTDPHLFANFDKIDNRHVEDGHTKLDQCELIKGIEFGGMLKGVCVDGTELAANDIEKCFGDYEKSVKSSYKLSVLEDTQEYSEIKIEQINCYQEFKENGNVEFDSYTTDVAKVCSDIDTESTKNCCVGDSAVCDDELDSDGRPTGERWPPLGAPNDDEDNQSLYSYTELSWQRGHYGRQYSSGGEEERLQQLEEEQEQLNNSLMALTSHFAQVQFRLKQIVDASPEEKEILLRQLEEFANRGIPDVRDVAVGRKSTVSEHSEGGVDTFGITRQKELIEQLKQQLEDLENYVYQTGEGGPPQAKVMEKQRIIIEQLKGKLNFNVDEFDKLTVDDLRVKVDHAIRELVNPLKMKEQLVAQLQTQIIDLERFIEFLQDEGTVEKVKGPKTPCNCDGDPPRRPGDGKSQESGSKWGKTGTQRNKNKRTAPDQEQLRKETENIMKRAATLMSMLSFGCGTSRNRFRKNTLKKTPQGNHYGDLRAALELAISNLLELLGPETPVDSDYTSDSEEMPIMAGNEELTQAVRKHLAPSLRDLIQHGLMPVGQSQSLVPFLSCFPQQSQKPTKLMHAWDLILKYYHLKKGDQYNRTPARRLSQSFNLEITGGSAMTNKQTLLGVIGSIISSHTPLKRSYDSHFKAFICAAINQKKLIIWLRLIFRTQALTENYYQSWSYVSKTGFEDALRSLERINKHNFNLPIDLAVRPFQNIKDAF